MSEIALHRDAPAGRPAAGRPRVLVAAGDEVPAVVVDGVVAAVTAAWPGSVITIVRGELHWDAGAPEQWEWITRLESEGFGQAIIVGDGSCSPYPLAYACHMAGIPFRSGVSLEFGGGLLTRRLEPLGPGRYPPPEEFVEMPCQKECR